MMVDGDYEVGVNTESWSLNTYALTATASDKYTVEFLVQNPDFELNEEMDNWDEMMIVLDDTSAIEHGAEVTVRITVADAYNQNWVDNTNVYIGERAPMMVRPGNGAGVYEFGMMVDNDYEIYMNDSEWALNTYTLNTANGTGYTVEVEGSNVYGETQDLIITVASSYVDSIDEVVVTVAGEEVELDWEGGEDGAMVAVISFVNGTDLTDIEIDVTVEGVKANHGIIPVNYLVETLAGGSYKFNPPQSDAEGVDNGEGVYIIDIDAYVGENAKEIAGFTYEKYEYEAGAEEANIYYTRNSYNVTFFDAEGAEIAGYGSMKYGASIEKPEDPIKADDGETYYTFAGWALSADGDVVDVLSTVPVDGIAYYPVYTANVYTYTVNVAEGAGYTLTAEGANTAEDAITFTFALTEEDWNTENLVITIAGQNKTAQLLAGEFVATPAELGLSKGGEIAITVEGLAYNLYAINGLEGEGYTINVNESASEWKKGATVTFEIELATGYTQSTPIVKIGGEEIVAEEGVYSFVLEGNTEIVVEGVEPNTYTVAIPEGECYTTKILDSEGNEVTEVVHGEKYTIYVEVDANYNRSNVTIYAYVEGVPGSIDMDLGAPSHDKDNDVYFYAVKDMSFAGNTEVEIDGVAYNNYAVSANVNVYANAGRISDVTEISVKVDDGEAEALIDSAMVLGRLAAGTHTLTFIDNDTTGTEFFSNVLRTIEIEVVAGGADINLGDIYLGHYTLTNGNANDNKHIKYTAEGIVDVVGDENSTHGADGKPTSGTISIGGGMIADKLVGDWEISYTAKYNAATTTETDPGMGIKIQYGEKSLTIYTCSHSAFSKSSSSSSSVRGGISSCFPL